MHTLELQLETIMKLQIFVYGTLKRGFPLEIKTEAGAGIVTACEPATLPIGQLYQDAQEDMRYFPYLVLDEQEFISYTRETNCKEDLNDDANRMLDVFKQDDYRWEEEETEDSCVIGELYTIEGELEELTRRLKWLDTIESYEPGKNYYGRYIRRNTLVNVNGKSTSAFTYCMVLTEKDYEEYVPVPNNEWTDTFNGEIPWEIEKEIEDEYAR